MALSHDEQRKLAEIERRLTTADPGFASRMRAFGRSSFGMLRPAQGRRMTVVRPARRSAAMRIVASVLLLALVGAVSLLVYVLVPFRAGGSRILGARGNTSTGQSATAVSTSQQPRSTAAGTAGGAVATTGAGNHGPQGRSPVPGSTWALTREHVGHGAVAVSPTVHGP